MCIRDRYSGLLLKPQGAWGGDNDGGGDGGEGGEVGRVLRALREAAERACRRSCGEGDSTTRSLLPPQLMQTPPTANPSSSFFNSCLLNLYRSGRDAIGWHSDDEALFGLRPVIASVSLGERAGMRRDFFLRRRKKAPPPGATTSEPQPQQQQQRQQQQDQLSPSSCSAPPRPRFWAPLGGDGDVLVMAGRAQEEYMHSVPARTESNQGRRVSLTFRRVVGGAEG
jgi:hypothetical protein